MGSRNNRREKYEAIKKDLERQKGALLAGVAEIISNGLNPGGTNLSDLGDQASAEADQNFILRLKGREQRLLKKIDEAMERIANGTFGICDSCGEEIDYKRLKARPVTVLCIECKTREEEEEKTRR